jgi:putative membrane protein
MSERRRLHPAAVAQIALDQLKGLALPIVIGAVLGGGASAETPVWALLLGFVGTLVAVVAAYARWQTTWYRVEPAAIRFREGVLGERMTTIPLARVQGIDEVRGPVQRLFGVVEVHVQAAGGGAQGEIRLPAVSPEAAEELRAALRSAGASLAAPEAPEPAATWRLGGRELVVAALTSGSLGVLLPVVAGLSQVADDLLGAEDARALLPDTAQEVALVAAAVLGVAWLLSVLGTVVAFAGTTVTREGDRVLVRRGFVQRRAASVPVARIGAVRVVENPLREPLGLAQVRLDTAGYATEGASARTLLPLVRRGDVPRVLAELLPELTAGLEGLDALAGPPRRGVRRYVVPPVVGATVLAGVVVATAGAPGAVALALLPLAALYGLARHRAAGWRLDGDRRLLLRGRRLARTTAIADPRRLQLLLASTSPFQRRAGLATVGVGLAAGGRLRVAHLERATADALLAGLREHATR